MYFFSAIFSIDVTIFYNMIASSSSFIIILFLNKTYILRLDWPADSYASLDGPVYQ